MIGWFLLGIALAWLLLGLLCQWLLTRPGSVHYEEWVSFVSTFRHRRNGLLAAFGVVMVFGLPSFFWYWAKRAVGRSS